MSRSLLAPGEALASVSFRRRWSDAPLTAMNPDESRQADDAGGRVGGPPPPSPVGARGLDDVVVQLKRLRDWAGQPSHGVIAERIGADRASRSLHAGARRVSRATVYDCFRLGRTRLDPDLLVEIVRALGVEPAQAESWRHAYGAVVGRLEPLQPIEIWSTMPSPGVDLIGRTSLLERLVGAPPGSSTALSGMAGVGKTQLAVAAATELVRSRAMTPLFVALRGAEPGRRPADARTVLDELLRFIGVSPGRLRRLSVDERAALWSAWVADHRAVVVLDDAVDGEQVHALLGPRHEGRTIVTSRRQLSTVDHCELVGLDPLPVADAVGLLERLSRRSWRASESGVAARIAELCGCLPIELATAAAAIADRPDWALDDHWHRLSQLPRGTAVGPALAATMDTLTPAARSMLHHLALHPGSRFGAWSASALTGSLLSAAMVSLGELAAAHLVQPVDDGADGRFTMHDLVRERARAGLSDSVPHRAQRDAVERLGDATLLAVIAAGGPVAVLNVLAKHPIVLAAQARVTSPDAIGDGGVWLASERSTVLGVADLLIDFGLPDHAAVVVLALAPLLDGLGQSYVAATGLERVLSAPDPDLRAAAHRELALARHRLGHNETALAHVSLAAELASDPQPIRTTALLGGIYMDLGRLHDALREHRAASEEAERAGDQLRTGRALANVGGILRMTGELPDAVDALLRARDLLERAGDEVTLMLLHGNLGLVYDDMGRDDEAIAQLRQSIAMGEVLGSDLVAAGALQRIAGIHRRSGRLAEAMETVEQSVAKARELGNDGALLEAEVERAEVLLARGDAGAAADEFESVLERARGLKDRAVETEALNGLGATASALGDVTGSIAFHREALEVADAVGDRLGAERARRGMASHAARFRDG